MELINRRQDELIDEFSVLDNNMEIMLDYIIDLGSQLDDFPEEKRTEENLVKGCQSKVWMTAEMENEKIVFKADSNTTITKGLVSLLLRIFNQSYLDDMLNAEIYFPNKIGMNRFIGTQRSNGFAAMIKQMKIYAIALKATEKI